VSSLSVPADVVAVRGVGRCVASPAGQGPPRDDLEARLVERARSGDFEAFAELVRRYQAGALRVATVVLGTPDGADDVVQESTERAWRAVDRFRSGAAFRPWWLRIVANAARNERRSKGRRASLAVRAGARRAGDVAVSAEDVVVGEEERRRVLDALNRLDADDRLTIGLRFFEHLSEREMADVLEVPAGTVKSRLSRAKERLRAELAHQVAASEEVGRRG
jgi:RNA polymerase sigma-70 factor (ECF subfamily)